MKLQSQKALVKASKEEIIAFLSDARHLYHLLPQNKISDWKADESQCSFKVQGAIIITLVEDGKTENQVMLRSGEKSPFAFGLTIELSDADGGTEGYIAFDGEVSMFLKMMVEKPLAALFDYMTKALQTHFQSK